jgi:hypothetical protein
MSQGIAMFGSDGIAAVKTELLQIHESKVLISRQHSDLTRQQKNDAFAYLMYLKRKRCEKIKGRGCADGQKQQDYIIREDAASTTVATEAVL